MNFKNRFPRKSDADGKGMKKGYIFNNGEYLCQSEEYARKYVKSLGLIWETEKETINTIDEWFYFTDWEEFDFEQYFDKDGNEYRMCKNCKTETKVYTSFYFCFNCLIDF